MLHVNRALGIADATSDIAVSVEKEERAMSMEWEEADEVCTKFGSVKILPTCLT